MDNDLCGVMVWDAGGDNNGTGDIGRDIRSPDVVRAKGSGVMVQRGGGRRR